jgi:hypothetical protein
VTSSSPKAPPVSIEQHFSGHLTDTDVKTLTRALEKLSAHARPLRPGRIGGS